MISAGRARRWLLMLLALGTICYLLLEIILTKKTRPQRLSVSFGVPTFQYSFPSALRNASVREQTLEVPLKSGAGGGKLSSLQKASLLNTSSERSLDRTKNDSNVVLEIFKSLNTSSTSSRDRPKNDSNVVLEIFKSLNTSSTSSHDRPKNDSNVLTTLKPVAPASGEGVRPEKCRKCFLTDFPELIPNDAVCKTGSNYTLDLVMLVLTTHSAVGQRQAIRQTWASLTQNNTAAKVRHVFLLGRSRDAGHMRSVQEEQAKYGDIVMHDYIDSYGNLTLKTLSGFHWLLKHCPNVRFFLKVDDDMWMNVPALLNLLQKEEEQLQTAVGGSCRLRAEPIRDSGSKWYASFKSYPQPVYPGYCSGTAYTSSLNVARSVVRVSPDVPFFHLEDVYVALCIRELGGNFVLKSLPGFYHSHEEACVLRAPETVTVHQVSAKQLLDIWSAKCP